MRLSVTKSSKISKKVFFKKWIIFLVSFFKEISQEDLEQIVFNLWDEDITEFIKELIEAKKLQLVEDNLKLGLAVQEKEMYQGVNFKTCPRDPEDKLKDLWDIGDDLRKHIKKSEVDQVFQELIRIVDANQEFHFHPTSFAKNYLVRAGISNSYVRYFE